MSHYQFSPCPSSPNCVSTMADPADAEHYLAPLKVQPEAHQKQWAAIVEYLEGLKRSRLVEKSDCHLRFEFKSWLFRYVDDFELYFDKKHHKLHFRSASRVGHSDFGVNRKRVSKIRAWINEHL